MYCNPGPAGARHINDSLPIINTVRDPFSAFILTRPRSSSTIAMLAPYPDRLRSSRSTPAQPNANSTSTLTPSPPPSQAFSSPSASSSTPHHRLFSSRSNLPLSRMRTNSLSSPSPPHADSPSSSTDFVLPSSLRNGARRPQVHARPSTSSGIPDRKHPPVVPIVVTSPFAGPSHVPVGSLFAATCHRLFTHHLQLEAICRLHANSKEKHQKALSTQGQH